MQVLAGISQCIVTSSKEINAHATSGAGLLDIRPADSVGRSASSYPHAMIEEPPASLTIFLLRHPSDSWQKHRGYLTGVGMQGEEKERWRELCEQAANEQDPDKLLTLVEEITRLLKEREDRLRKGPSKTSAT